MADDIRCCVWCKATMAESRQFLSRKRTVPRLCMKCTLWALMGQTPPYVPPRREHLPSSFPPPRAHEAPSARA